MLTQHESNAFNNCLGSLKCSTPLPPGGAGSFFIFAHVHNGQTFVFKLPTKSFEKKKKSGIGRT